MNKQDKPWTVCEAQYVIDHYETMSCPGMGVILGRSHYSVDGMIRQLGIRKISMPVKTKKKERKLVFTSGIKDWLLGEAAL